MEARKISVAMRRQLDNSRGSTGRKFYVSLSAWHHEYSGIEEDEVTIMKEKSSIQPFRAQSYKEIHTDFFEIKAFWWAEISSSSGV